MPALACLGAALLAWPQAAPLAAEAEKAGKPTLPGAKECAYKLPPHRDWTAQETWAWEQGICLGKIANMRWFGGGDGKGCDPEAVDEWPDTRDLSAAFLQTILGHEPYRGALTRTGLRIRCARFTEPLDLSHMVIARLLGLHASRFQQTVTFLDLRSSSLISLQRSVFDGKFWADRLNVAGNLFMERGAHFKGEVRLSGAKIGGQLSAIGSTFDGLFNGNRLEVAGGLFMGGGAHFKDVALIGAKVGGNLEAIGSTFDGKFTADGLEVAGSLFMRDNASFKSVNLISSTIGQRLQLSDSEFDGDLDLTSVSIGDEFQLTSPGNPPPRWTKNSTLTLRNARVGALNDTKEAWDIQSGNLDLIGFTYDRLGGLGATEKSAMSARSTEWLLGWLAKQDGFATSYNPQPFEQLAKVLRESGYPEKADQILFAAQNHRRDSPTTPGVTKALLRIEYGLIGYGYHSWIALVWFAGLTVLGAWACSVSKYGRRMRPLQLIFYSFDMALPLIDLNKRHERVKLDSFAVVYFYFHKIAGFVLVSFLIAGLSGLTK